MANRIPLKDVSPAAYGEEHWRHGLLWRGIDELQLELGDWHWYGMGALLNHQWPLEKLAFPETRFLTSDNGRTGLLGILDPFWVNSNGLGVLVDGDDLEVSFNAPLTHDSRWMTADYRKLPNIDRPPLSRLHETDGLLRIKGRNLSVFYFLKNTAREVVEAYFELLPHCPPPPRKIFERPMWTTWAHFKNDISQEKVLETAKKAVLHGFSPGVFGIDAKWQSEFGDTSFDPVKFPRPKELVSELHSLGCEVTLWLVPFIMPSSENYRSAVEGGFVYKNPDGSPYFGRWWEGESVFLDFTNPAAMDWYVARLEELTRGFGIDGFKFDAGEGDFYGSRGMTAKNPCPANRLAGHYLSPLAKRYPWSDARAGWKSQGLPMLFRQWDKKTTWGYDNGLASCITQSLTLNILGYLYSFPDMIGGNEWSGDRANEELLVRWTEAVAPMPVIQFSVPVWREGRRCTEICARYAALHRELAVLHENLACEKMPILRPLWWIAPTDEEALSCADEYLVGNKLLVAPVINAGAETRDIYLPDGSWSDYWSGQSYQGAAWLRDFPAPLDVLPLFHKQ